MFLFKVPKNSCRMYRREKDRAAKRFVGAAKKQDPDRRRLTFSAPIDSGGSLLRLDNGGAGLVGYQAMAGQFIAIWALNWVGG